MREGGQVISTETNKERTADQVRSVLDSNEAPSINSTKDARGQPIPFSSAVTTPGCSRFGNDGSVSQVL